MRTILGQLALDKTNRRRIKEFLCAEYERQVAIARVDELDLLRLRTRDCVRLILELAERDPLTIVVDAVDTVEENERHILIDALKEIILKADNVVKILLTSRSNNRTIVASAADKQIQITSHETEHDMKRFVNHQVDAVITSKLLLEGTVSTSLRSMFLWVKLQIERLCRETLENDVITALQDKLPQDLDLLYQETLSHVSKAGPGARDIAVKVFSWIIYMREPLTPSALLAALYTYEDSTLRLTQLMAICANLVVLDDKCNVVRFAHQSVQEFLGRQEPFTASVAHNLLASVCIEACSRGPAADNSMRLPSDDFYVYAAMYWPVHSQMAESMAPQKTIIDKMSSFVFDADFDTTLAFESWIGKIREFVPLLARDHTMKPSLDAIPDCQAEFLFLASVFGLNGLLRLTLSNVEDLDLNQKNKHGQTPVYLAAALGHPTTVSVLVDSGANVNTKCGRRGSPLHAACFAGHLEVVNLLLKLGASISCGDIFGNALQAAFRGGHEDVALELIERASLVETEDDFEQALEGAARVGFLRVVQRLQGLSFMSWSKSEPEKSRKRTKKAIEGGQLGVLRQFMDQVEDRDLLPPDAVALATLYSHKDLVEFLLDQDMSIEAECVVGTPLRTACLINCLPIVRLLLDRGADINACGSFGAALQIAASKGHTSIVRLLIDEGANLNQQSGFYGTALQAAAYHGQHPVVEALLGAGAQVHAKGYSKDAFHAAAEGGNQDIIMLMLKKGYKFSHPPPEPMCSIALPSPNKKLLRDASPGRDSERYGHKRSFWTTDGTAARVERPTSDLETVLREAKGGFNIARLKSKESSAAGYKPQADPWQRKNYPLEAAASAGHEGTVRLLLEQRKCLGIPEEQIGSAVKVAASNCHLTVLQILLDDVANRQPVTSYIESILEVGRKIQSQAVVDYALALASKYCSADEITKLKQRLVRPADKYHHAEVGKETLLSDFTTGCTAGDFQLINAILETKHHEALSSFEIGAGLQLCASHGQSTVTQLLLASPFLQGRIPLSGEEAFVTAASSGFLDMMKLLASYWADELTTNTSVAVTRALTVACENGHVDVARYLVRDLAVDVNSLALDRKVGPSLTKSRRNHPFVADRSSSESSSQAVKLTEEPAISPLQAALRGFARFNHSEDPLSWIEHDSKNHPKTAAQPQQEEVIIFLLDNGAKINDLGGQSTYPIQLAAKSCPDHIVEIFISGGAEVNATRDGESALSAAAGRELSAHAVVRRLLVAGAIIPEDIEEQNRLLEQALHFFKSTTSGHYFHDDDNTDGQFLQAPSLEYVFTEGSGAVLFNLISQMPRVQTTDIGWTIVLQMAALLDDQPFVDLLLSRGTDVNSVGYYYGTALQAAARYGHSGIVEKLLGAGAEVNALEGHWKTALRAALVGGYACVVQTLLDHGADIELGAARHWSYINNLSTELATALQFGVSSGSLMVVKVLLAKGANVAHDEIGTLHPLILASQQGSIDIVRELLDTGAPLNIQWKKQHKYDRIVAAGASPIHAAIIGGHPDIVELLLSRGANIEINVEGCGTPLSVAASDGQVEMVRLLLSFGATALDGAALSGAVRNGNIEVVRELLAAGSKAAPALVMACRQGRLPVLELLLEKSYQEDDQETAIEEAFALPGLDDSVFRLLLDYVAPTMRRFVQACAAGSVASVESILEETGIDVNTQDEESGDYSIQIAASYLQAEVMGLLLSRGADVNCKSSKHGTPMMTALEACAASMLRRLESEQAKKLVAELFIPIPRRERVYDYGDGEHHSIDPFYDGNTASTGFRQLSQCETIVNLLITYGANVTYSERPFGSPLHLACLLGSRTLVQTLLEQGADIDKTAGYFEKAIFAALQGSHSDVVALLLEKTPLTKHIHEELGTPLHLACSVGDSVSVRKLLELGANASALNAKGQTSLTVALEKESRRGFMFERSHVETPLKLLMKLGKPLHILEDDLMAAADDYGTRKETLNLLLATAKDMVVSERVICRVLRRGSVDEETIGLLMQRSDTVGATADMLKTVRDHRNLEKLLKHRPACQITPDILIVQWELKCMKLLLDVDPETPVTEEVVLRALELGHERRSEGEDVLEILFERNTQITVTEDMLKATRCAADMQTLLQRSEPGKRISKGVIEATLKSTLWEPYRTMRLLLQFDPSIRLTPEMALGVICYDSGIDALEMLLEHDRSIPVTEEMFLQTCEGLSLRGRCDLTKLADLMHKYGKRLVFTDEVRDVIDRAYPDKSQAAEKERFYSLRMNDRDGDCLEPVAGSGQEEEEMSGKSLATSRGDRGDATCTM